MAKLNLLLTSSLKAKSYKLLAIDLRARLKASCGFSLVELLVSMTIFTLVMSAGSTIFLLALRAQRVTIAEQNVVDNTRFALEYMSRQLRFARRDGAGSCITAGYTYELPIGSTDSIKFLDSQSRCIEYSLFAVGNGKKRIQVTIGAASPADLTVPSSVNILSFFLYATGQAQSDAFQPRVTIVMEVEGAGLKPGEKISTRLQTTISNRNPDL